MDKWPISIKCTVPTISTCDGFLSNIPPVGTQLKKYYEEIIINCKAISILHISPSCIINYQSFAKRQKIQSCILFFLMQQSLTKHMGYSVEKTLWLAWPRSYGKWG
jgi:hypothetical protein